MSERQEIPLCVLYVIRSFDLFFAISAIIFFSPLLILVVIALHFTGEGEVFFRQVRIGKERREFYLIKFATMMKQSSNYSFVCFF